ncbi:MULTISPECIES: Hsp20/alpha crystallin family protein [Pseudomonadota]|uniref:Hsp20/alpha crystallin family protein n=1 Tax=Pseudomonadota TaxID=1224 RepID=UPI00076A9438|nr:MULTISPECIES: Hsp20/alpha crystallin family protein [Pseudomonadota]
MALRDLIPWGKQDSQVPVRVSSAGDHPLLSLHREVNRVFDDLFRGIGLPALNGFSAGHEWPHVELSESEKEVRVTAELPGLDEKDVDVSIDDGVLSIRGEKRSEVDDKERGYSERSYGRFERHIRLPSGIEEDKVSATFKKGVLNVVLPRSATAIESRRRIPITTH